MYDSEFERHVRKFEATKRHTYRQLYPVKSYKELFEIAEVVFEENPRVPRKLLRLKGRSHGP